MRPTVPRCVWISGADMGAGSTPPDATARASEPQQPEVADAEGVRDGGGRVREDLKLNTQQPCRVEGRRRRRLAHVQRATHVAPPRRWSDRVPRLPRWPA